MMAHNVETNPGPPESITECLEFLVSTKREFDEDDVRLLGRLLLSFKWCSKLTAGFRRRLGMKAKQGGGPCRSWKKNVRRYHAGPGRGKRGLKCKINTNFFLDKGFPKEGGSDVWEKFPNNIVFSV